MAACSDDDDADDDDADDDAADDDLVAAWWTYQRLLVGSRAERKALETGEPAEVVAAADTVHERIAQGGREALSLVLALVRSAATAEDLASVGAGPLEDLLVEHGQDLAVPIDEATRRVPALATALRSVWWAPPDRVPDRILRRWLPAGS